MAGEEEGWGEAMASLPATGREAKDYQQRNGEVDGDDEGGLTNDNVISFTQNFLNEARKGLEKMIFYYDSLCTSFLTQVYWY